MADTSPATPVEAATYCGERSRQMKIGTGSTTATVAVLERTALLLAGCACTPTKEGSKVPTALTAIENSVNLADDPTATYLLLRVAAPGAVTSRALQSRHLMASLGWPRECTRSRMGSSYRSWGSSGMSGDSATPLS